MKSTKDFKSYLIFPIWVMAFIPPILFITLIGNFIIESFALIISFYIYQLFNTGVVLKEFYKKNIFKIWGSVSLVHIISFLFLLAITGDFLDLCISNDIIDAIIYDPYSNPLALLIIAIVLLTSGYFIFILNYKFVLNEQIQNKKLRFRVALTIAIIAIPWIFLIPTKWVY